MPIIRAGLMVIARSAVSRSRPSLTARVAWCTRKWIGTTGWSVMIAISTPAAASLPGLASDRLRSSTFDREVNSGPMSTGMPLAANRSAIRCASVPWSMTSR